MDLSRRGQGDGEEGQVPPPVVGAVGVGLEDSLPPANNDEVVEAIMAMGINREDALLVR